MHRRLAEEPITNIKLCRISKFKGTYNGRIMQHPRNIWHFIEMITDVMNTPQRSHCNGDHHQKAEQDRLPLIASVGFLSFDVCYNDMVYCCQVGSNKPETEIADLHHWMPHPSRYQRHDPLTSD
jgi:hypothetical protein